LEDLQLSAPDTHLSPLLIVPAGQLPNTAGTLGRVILFGVEVVGVVAGAGGNPKPPPRISIPGQLPLASIGSGGHVC
jgi:hypothetical protein